MRLVRSRQAVPSVQPCESGVAESREAKALVPVTSESVGDMRDISNGRIQFSIALTCLLTAPYSSGQIGSDCSDLQPCQDLRQECSHGYCRCVTGFVTVLKTCLPERSFNESCSNDAQCVDFRMKCFAGICTCVKYYHWDEYSRECLTLKNLTYMLNDMEEKYDTAGRLSAETQAVFTGLVWAGVAVMAVGVVLALGCSVYGCCYQRMHNKRIENGGKMTCHRSSCPTACSVYPIETLQSNAAMEGAACDYVPGLFQTTSFDVI